MRKKISLLSITFTLLVLLFSGCDTLSHPPPTPKPAATETPTPEPQPPTAIPVLGEAGKPILLALVPGISGFPADTIEWIIGILGEHAGVEVEMVTARDYAEVVGLLCDGDAHIGVLDTSSYIEASELGCAEAALIAMKDGSPTQQGQIVVHQNSGLEYSSVWTQLSNLEGEAFCRPNHETLIGWVLPSWHLQAAEIDPLTTFAQIIDTGGDKEVIEAIHNGDCVLGSTYADARDAAQSSIPGVMEEITVIAHTAPVPYENISFSPQVPDDMEMDLIYAFLFLKDYEDKRLIKELYGWDGLIIADDSMYTPLREVMQSVATAEFDPTPADTSSMTILVEDDFSGPDTTLELGEFEGGSLALREGVYAVTSLGWYVWGITQTKFTDVAIDVDAIIVTLPESRQLEYSIRCREQPDYDGYRFVLNGEDSFAVLKMQNSEIQPLIGWTPADALNPPGETNHFKVVCIGNTLKLFINDALVFEGQDDAFIEGVIGLGGLTKEDEQPLEVHFDNLVVSDSE
jgi:phosphonate transport system substrate-binding protein